MIRITGRDAVAEALFNKDYCIYADIHFFICKNKKDWPIPPALIPILIEDGEITTDNVVCEIPSIWDLIERKRATIGLSFFKEEDLVVVFSPHNPDPQDYRSFSIKPFAVKRSDFDRAEEWARTMPALNEDDVPLKWLNHLRPRINLKRGAWQKDRNLLENAGRLINILESIYGVKIPSPDSRELHEKEFPDSDGPRFDQLLDAITNQYVENGLPPPTFCLPETGSELRAKGQNKSRSASLTKEGVPL